MSLGTPNYQKYRKKSPQIKPNCGKNHSRSGVKSNFTSKLIFGQILVAILDDIWYQNRSKIDARSTSVCGLLLRLTLDCKTRDADVLQKPESFKTLGGLFKNRRCACCYLCCLGIQICLDFGMNIHQKLIGKQWKRRDAKHTSVLHRLEPLNLSNFDPKTTL